MPTILMTRDMFGPSGALYAKGETYTVDTGLAQQLQGDNAAQILDPELKDFGAPAENADAASMTLTTTQANTQRNPTGALTYTITAATDWAVGDGMLIYLPASGTISFAVSGGATINGGTTTLTRAIADNGAGIVALSRIQGSNAYGLTGA